MRQTHFSLQNMPVSWQWQLLHGCTICCSLSVTGYLLFMAHFFLLAEWLLNPQGALSERCAESPDVNTYANTYFHENSLAHPHVLLWNWDNFPVCNFCKQRSAPSLCRKAQVKESLLPPVLRRVAAITIYKWTEMGVWEKQEGFPDFLSLLLHKLPHVSLLSQTPKLHERYLKGRWWEGKVSCSIHYLLETPGICHRQWRFFLQEKAGIWTAINTSYK